METDKKLETRNEKREEGRRVWLTRYLPLLLWIGVILFLSTGQGSMTRTSLIIRPILEFLFPSAPEETLVFYHGVIRKLAHFTEYAILASLALRAAVGSLIRPFQWLPFLLAFGLVIVIACVDEFNQSFESTRTGAVADIALDVFGGASMLIFLAALNKVRAARSAESPSKLQ